MKSLQGLSDKDLLSRLHKLVEKEKALTLEVLAHLAEVDRRELYLGKGYSTLTNYCIGEMGYGESSAGRRARIARIIKDMPEVYDLLEKDKLTFSAILQVTRALTPNNKTELLPRLIGKTRGRDRANRCRVLAAAADPGPCHTSGGHEAGGCEDVGRPAGRRSAKKRLPAGGKIG
jgi:hypothetical protein